MDDEYRIRQMNKDKAVSDAILSTRFREEREKGIEQGKCIVALELLKTGKTIDYVSKVTGLDIETLKRLRSEQ